MSNQDSLKQQPLFQAAYTHHQSGELEKAKNLYLAILKTDPYHIDALHLIGLIFKHEQDYESALIYMENALKLKPDFVELHYNKGNVLLAQKRYLESVECYQNALNYDPTHLATQKNISQAYFCLGNEFIQKQDYGLAITYFHKVLNYSPELSEAYYSLGYIYEKRNDQIRAIQYYHQALRLNPNLVEACNNLGLIYLNKGQFELSEQLFRQGLNTNSNYAPLWNNLGNLYKAKNQLTNARDAYQQAVNLNQNDPEPYKNLGDILRQENKIEETILYYKQALLKSPNHKETVAQLFHQEGYLLDWDTRKDLELIMAIQTQQSLILGERPSETPFIHLTHREDESENYQISKLWSQALSKPLLETHPKFEHPRGKLHKKLRIGYLSSDFHDHATLHLMFGLFQDHDRTQFEIYIYSYGPIDQGFYQTTLRQNVDVFHTVSELSSVQIAEKIYQDNIQILVELKGYTLLSRFALCSLRPAPIQISYLGYPGTTGSQFIDYFITDSIVTPASSLPFYSEQPIYMPYSYQANHAYQKIDISLSHSSVGLPKNKFVFGCFNSPYKLTEKFVSLWFKLLKSVPDSVFWFYLPDPTAQDNLLRFAKRQGVDPNRLIFADKLPKADHLARLHWADLMVDTEFCNGHTTTSDALYAGVPVITLSGQQFASRVSHSLLNSLGLTECVAYSLEQYESLILKYASNPTMLKELRAKTKAHQTTHPLFNSASFTRTLESGYILLWKRYENGQKCEPLTLEWMS